MIQEKVRVLLTEDSPTNAAVVMKYITVKSDGNFEVVHVETLAGCLVNLAQGGFDVVLLDLSLPDSEGVETVKAVRRADTDIPVVVLTATEDETLAMEAIKFGAQDYLVKGRDIGAQVVRAIHYAIERQQIAIKIQESEKRFKDYAEIAADWFWETDSAHNFTYISGRFEEIFDMSPAKLIGESRLDFILQGASPEIFDDHLGTLTEHRPFKHLIYKVTINNRTVHVQVSGKPIFSKKGNFLGYRGIGSNITDRIEADMFAEKMLTMFVGAMEAFPYGCAIFDPQDNFIIGNALASDALPGCGDVLMSGKSFGEIIEIAIERGVLAPEGAGDSLSGELVFKSNQGNKLVINQYRTENGGLLRIFKQVDL